MAQKIINRIYAEYLLQKNPAKKYFPVLTQPFTSPEIQSSAVHSKASRILAAQNADLKGSPADKYLNALPQDNCQFIFTGQQLGLFISPLYTIYKALTAVKLAEELNSSQKKVIYIPVFWLESEDHDFEEVREVGVWDKQGAAHRFRYEGAARQKTSLRHYQFDESVSGMIDAIKDAVLQTEFSEAVFNELKKTFKTGENWLAASRAYFKQLMGKTGILFFEPGAKDIKHISADFFTTLAKHNRQAHQAFAARSLDLIEDGYHNQVSVLENQTFIHIEDENLQRNHVRREGNGFYFKGQPDKVMTEEDLVALIRRNPEAVSTTVVSRPLLQSWLFPVVAYVGGPGEIAYWGQLGKLFEYFEISEPVLYPRISVSLIEPRVKKLLNKYDISCDTIVADQKEFIDQQFSKDSTSENNPLLQLKTAVNEKSNAIKAWVTEQDPTLETVFEKSFQRIIGQFEALNGRMTQVAKQKSELKVNHLGFIHQMIFPKGIKQERFAAPLYFLNKFGPKFLDTIYNAIELDRFETQKINLDS